MWARGRAGFSQRELHRRTGVAQATISSIERGKSDPSMATLEKLLAACAAWVEARSAYGFDQDHRGCDLPQIRDNLKRSPAARLGDLRAVNGLRAGRRVERAS